MPYLNLVFHKIERGKDSPYSIHPERLEEILGMITHTRSIADSAFVNIFFDDGSRDILGVTDALKKFNIRPKIGIVTDMIGSSEQLDVDEIRLLDIQGYEICSHSCSHPALSLPGQTGVIADGKYESASRGKEYSLTKKQILFQLSESKDVLERIIKHPVESFIYPYGLFNSDVVSIIEGSHLYKEAYTCEKKLDRKENLFACPRILYTNNYSPSSFVNLVREVMKSSVVGT